MIGLEPTFDEHLENLVAVFREVRRVLRDDGTLWLNYGDAYASSGLTGRADAGQSTWSGGAVPGEQNRVKKPDHCLKPKDLMMMPARVALALQADGWWLRSEIIWHKPNPMPESCTDRPTSAHDKVFLLTKSPRYFYDAEAVRVPYKPSSLPRYDTPMQNVEVQNHQPGRERKRENRKRSPNPAGANLRNVWTIPTQGVSDAHFATFPEKLVEPCILAGTSAKGACAKCGAPWVRVVETAYRKNYPSAGNDPRSRAEDKQAQGSISGEHGWKGNNLLKDVTTLGWKPTCECDAETVPCTVLDPFAGSGTTVRVSTRLNRMGIGCDLAYHDIATRRTSNVQRGLY